MRVLALDTTGAQCSAALVDGDILCAVSQHKIGRGHAEFLGPQVAALLLKARLGVKDLDRIAVCNGPGSFTGLRVALSFAKGLALPWGHPVLGVSALELLARQADPEGERRVIAAQDVRRGEIFWQVFDKGRARGKAALGDLAAVKATQNKGTLIVGSAAPLFGFEGGDIAPNAAVLAWHAAILNPKDYPAAPLYHRAPDAKLPGGISVLEPL